MNFFIDFEATQFSNHIISVGCVTEKGDHFYSLVNTEHTITTFITELTGITENLIAAAPSPEIVFSNLMDWVEMKTFPEKPHFYCYGNSDKQFVRTNFNDCKTMKASMMLSYLYTDLEDYGDKVKAHFGLNQNVSLLKVYNYCEKTDIKQSHNALEDAKMLCKVAQYISNHEEEFEKFPEYKEIIEKKKLTNQISEITEGKNYIVHRMNSRKVLQTYNSFDEAVEWAYSQIPEGAERDKANIKTIAKNIKKANNGYDEKKKYMNYRWKIIRKG